MKALGILMIGTTCLLAGCACDCDDKLGANGTAIDTVGNTVGTTGNDAAGTDANSTNNTWGDVGTGTGTKTGNTSPAADEDATTGANSGTGSNTNTPKETDPRTYNQSGGGMGYRTDTINEYDGKNGSASDKGSVINKKP